MSFVEITILHYCILGVSSPSPPPSNGEEKSDDKEEEVDNDGVDVSLKFLSCDMYMAYYIRPEVCVVTRFPEE